MGKHSSAEAKLHIRTPARSKLKTDHSYPIIEQTAAPQVPHKGTNANNKYL